MPARATSRTGRRWKTCSDAELQRMVLAGETAAFRTVYRRHYPAVFAYAASCASDAMGAHQLACQAFAGELRDIVAGGAVRDRRFPGCVRLRLLGAVRTSAVRGLSPGGTALHDGFRNWAAGGGQWPMDGGQLGRAFGRLPGSSQCLLWHMVAERDEPEVVSRVTGLPLNQLTPLAEQARDALWKLRVDAYTSRLPRQKCGIAAGLLDVAARPSAGRTRYAISSHLSTCSDCRNVYADLGDVNNGLHEVLPPLLLGWWPGEGYLRAKADTAEPLHDPPFLERALNGLGIEGQDHGVVAPPGATVVVQPGAGKRESRDAGPNRGAGGRSRLAGRLRQPLVRACVLGGLVCCSLVTALACVLSREIAPNILPTGAEACSSAAAGGRAGAAEPGRARALGGSSAPLREAGPGSSPGATIRRGVEIPAGKAGPKGSIGPARTPDSPYSPGRHSPGRPSGPADPERGRQKPGHGEPGEGKQGHRKPGGGGQGRREGGHGEKGQHQEANGKGKHGQRERGHHERGREGRGSRDKQGNSGREAAMSPAPATRTRTGVR